MNQPITVADEWFKGEDQTFDFVVLDDDGVPVDITAWTVDYELRKYAWSPEPLLADDVTVDDGDAGECSFTIAAADSEGLEAGHYWYSVRRTDTDDVTELFYGTAVLQRSRG